MAQSELRDHDDHSRWIGPPTRARRHSMERCARADV